MEYLEKTAQAAGKKAPEQPRKKFNIMDTVSFKTWIQTQDTMRAFRWGLVVTVLVSAHTYYHSSGKFAKSIVAGSMCGVTACSCKGYQYWKKKEFECLQFMATLDAEKAGVGFHDEDEDTGEKSLSAQTEMFHPIDSKYSDKEWAFTVQHKKKWILSGLAGAGIGLFVASSIDMFILDMKTMRLRAGWYTMWPLAIGSLAVQRSMRKTLQEMSTWQEQGKLRSETMLVSRFMNLHEDEKAKKKRQAKMKKKQAKQKVVVE